MDKKTFWTQKNPGEEFLTVTIEHPSFAAIRLLANKFVPATLGGEVYTPTTMKVTPPAQGNDQQPVLSVSFPRHLVGREFQLAVNAVKAAGSRQPIACTFRRWLDFDLTTPVEEYKLYATEDGVAWNKDGITIRAGDDNPMLRGVASLYTVDNYSGLTTL